MVCGWYFLLWHFFRQCLNTGIKKGCILCLHSLKGALHRMGKSRENRVSAWFRSASPLCTQPPAPDVKVTQAKPVIPATHPKHLLYRVPPQKRETPHRYVLFAKRCELPTCAGSFIGGDTNPDGRPLFYKFTKIKTQASPSTTSVDFIHYPTSNSNRCYQQRYR